MEAARAWPIRTAACDELIRRVLRLSAFNPPVDLASHPETKGLVENRSPARWRGYKLREDLLDAVICAWTAAYWQRHGLERSQVLGVPEQPGDDQALATIIAPARPEQRSP